MGRKISYRERFEMITKTKTVRMNLKSYKSLRSTFRAERGESAASYFERLAHYLTLEE